MERKMTNEEKKAYLDSIKGKVDTSIKKSPALKSSPKPATPVKRQEVKQEREIVQGEITLEALAKEIINHEDLIPFQTPFRIDEEGEMRKWRNIHGFKIDWVKNKNAPSSRRNFIFLKSQEDLLPAVVAQFRSYQRKGLNLEKAIRKFDQTGADGKIEFLKKKFPNLDISQKISAF